MITFKKGNLLHSNMQTLVNTVNCVGVMGNGIAFSFKQQFPEMFSDYASKCKSKQVRLGEPYPYVVSSFCLIINFPTKGHWKESSNIENIEKGLQHLVTYAKEWGVQSMAIPALGCGLGGLDWDDVSPLMVQYLSQLNSPVEVYSPLR